MIEQDEAKKDKCLKESLHRAAIAPRGWLGFDRFTNWALKQMNNGRAQHGVEFRLALPLDRTLQTAALWRVSRLNQPGCRFGSIKLLFVQLRS
jgi:hypothetical protein